MKSYACQFVLPKESPSNPLKWADNRSAVVLADSLAEAVAKVMAKYPDAAIHNINHTGTKEVIQ